MTGSTVRQKLEGFFINLGITFEEVGENMWVISDEANNLGHVVVFAEEEVVTVRANVMEIPSESREQFFEELLRLNAELLHGAYALEESHVILIDTLEFPTMDLEEFQASLDSTGLALAQHYPRLARYRKHS
jgi:hypothetical protein